MLSRGFVCRVPTELTGLMLAVYLIAFINRRTTACTTDSEDLTFTIDIRGSRAVERNHNREWTLSVDFGPPEVENGLPKCFRTDKY